MMVGTALAILCEYEAEDQEIRDANPESYRY